MKKRCEVTARRSETVTLPMNGDAIITLPCDPVKKLVLHVFKLRTSWLAQTASFSESVSTLFPSTEKVPNIRLAISASVHDSPKNFHCSRSGRHIITKFMKTFCNTKLEVQSVRFAAIAHFPCQTKTATFHNDETENVGRKFTRMRL